MSRTVSESRPLLSSAAVAKRLDISEKTVSRYVAAGLLESVRLPGGHRFEPDDLERFIASRRQAAGGAGP